MEKGQFTVTRLIQGGDTGYLEGSRPFHPAA
jgi:hypothetical protein